MTSSIIIRTAAVAEQEALELDRNRISRMELTPVLDMLFYSGHAGSILCKPRWMETQHREFTPPPGIFLPEVRNPRPER